MKKIIFAGIFLVTVVFTQTSILVFDFNSTGIDEATVFSVHELFKTELSDYGYNVRSAPRGDVCEDDECAAQGAVEAGTQEALYGSLVKLGDKIIVNVHVVDNTGNRVHSDKLTSESVEDLDVVIERLVKGIYEGVQAGDLIDKTNVTESEAKEPRRRKNYYTVGVQIGYRFPIANSYGKEEMWLYEGMAMYELEKVFITGRGYVSAGGEATGFGLNIGTYYITNPTDFAFFVGGAAGIEWAVVPVDPDHGDMEWVTDDAPSVMISGGLLAFQTYDFHLMVEARYQATFLGKVENEYYDYDLGDYTTIEVDKGIQHSFGISVGITRRTNTGDRSGCFPW